MYVRTYVRMYITSELICVLYAVDEGLRGQNVLHSVVMSLTESASTYVYAQDQFASYQQGSNEPLRHHARRRLSGVYVFCVPVCTYICTYMSL